MSSTRSDIGAEAMALLQYVKSALELSEKSFKRLQERLWVFSAYIRQPRKDDGKCNKTPLFERWDTNSQTSHLTVQDLRYASLQECQRVSATLAALLLEVHDIPHPPASAIALVEKVLQRQFEPQSLSCVHTGQAISGSDVKLSLDYSTQRLAGYEIPVSYRLELNLGGRHEYTNVGWMKPLHINYRLRKYLRLHLQTSFVKPEAINKALDKIQVKAYCTDKVTMPPHFSNRDFRWATWPNSIQYASHYQCAMIELELMAQLYEFAGAPALDKELTSDIAAVRGQPIAPGSRICFVTGRILNYMNYLQAAINPKGGKSKHHVGHILPLTRGGRHSRDNIAWASDDGNRIQGNDTLEEIEAKLVEAVEYHLRRDMALAQPPEVFHSKVEKLWILLNDIRQYLGKPRFPW